MYLKVSSREIICPIYIYIYIAPQRFSIGYDNVVDSSYDFEGRKSPTGESHIPASLRIILICEYQPQYLAQM